MTNRPKSGSRPKHPVKTPIFYVTWRTSKDRATVNNSSGYRGVDKYHISSSSSSIGEETYNNAQLTESVITGSRDEVDMLRKIGLLVKCHAKVTNRGRGDHTRKGLSQQVQVNTCQLSTELGFGCGQERGERGPCQE